MKCAGALTRKKARNRVKKEGVVTGEDCCGSSSEDDAIAVVVGRTKERREEEGGEVVVATGDAGKNHVRKTAAAGGGGCGDMSATKQWPTSFQSKCAVLKMEKELALQRWTQQCVEMAKRGTVSAPCTPRTTKKEEEAEEQQEEQGQEEEDKVLLVQRIEQLQKSRLQREQENEAIAVQGRVQLLQQRSKSSSSRNGGSSSSTLVVQKDKENSRALDPQILALQKGKIKGEIVALQETRVNDRRQQKETIDKIVTQVKADAKEWAKIQGMLKHVKGEMKTLQQKCDGWEQRALHAESKCAALQIEEKSWRVQAQLSEQRIKELEKEMAQVRAKMEEVKSHAALEQSRLIQAGCNHSYALVLKPVLRNSSSDICMCSSTSPDFEECKQCENWCHMPPNTRSRLTEKLLCKTCTSNVKKIDSTEHCMVCGLVLKVPDPRSISTPRIRRLSENSARKVQGVNSMRGARCSPIRQSKPSPDGASSKSNDESGLSSKNEMTISEIERSMAQNWFKQRQPVRRPKTACIDTSLQENNMNAAYSQPNPTRRRSEGKKSMKSRLPSASESKESPPHHLFQERLPLKETNRNAVHER